MSHQDLMEIVSHTKFDFHKFRTGHTIATPDKSSDPMLILLKGSLRQISEADNHSYHIEEQIYAPYIIQPERIFGLQQRYSMTYITAEPSSMMMLNKNEIMRLVDEHIIFRLNLINYTSTLCQRLSRNAWRTDPGTIRNRFVRFIEDRCTYPAGEKIIHIRMEDLGHEIHESRINVSRLLHYLTDEKLIKMDRGTIIIPKMEQLIQLKDKI